MGILQKFLRTRSETNYAFAKKHGLVDSNISRQVEAEETGSSQKTLDLLIKYMLLEKVYNFSGLYKGRVVKISISPKVKEPEPESDWSVILDQR
mgnify:FL=1